MASLEMNNDRQEGTSTTRGGFVYNLNDGSWYGFTLNPVTDYGESHSPCSTQYEGELLTGHDQGFKKHARRPLSEHSALKAEDRRASTCTHLSSTGSTNGSSTLRHSIAGSVAGSTFKDRYFASLRDSKEQ